MMSAIHLCTNVTRLRMSAFVYHTQSVILIDIQNNGRMTGVLPVNVCGCFFKQLVNRKPVTGAALKKIFGLDVIIGMYMG